MTNPLEYPFKAMDYTTGEAYLIHEDERVTDLDGNPILSDADRLKRLEARTELILEKMESVETMIVKVIAEVKPTIDELMNSSLFKMLGMKKK